MFTDYRCRSFLMLLGLLGLAGMPLTGSASHSWGGYHWRSDKAAPVTVRIGDNLTGKTWVVGYFDNTLSKWKQGDPSIPSAVWPIRDPNGGAAGSNLRKCWPTSQTVQVCNYTYGRNGWLGVATIWISSGHITQGTVKLNDTYFNKPPYNTTEWRNLVLCQEVGHTFGLDHQDEIFGNDNLGTCMDYTNNPAGPPNNQWPNKHDFEQLRDIYAHIDTSSSSSATAGSSGKVPPGMFRDFSEQSEWGKLIRESNGGRTAVYERDFGGGHKVVTFVIRAE